MTSILELLCHFIFENVKCDYINTVPTRLQSPVTRVRQLRQLCNTEAHPCFVHEKIHLSVQVKTVVNFICFQNRTKCTVPGELFRTILGYVALFILVIAYGRSV